jgi:diguanylate cyclase
MAITASSLTPILECTIDRINIGVFILNSRMEIVLWNHFMEVNSGQSSDTVIGRNLFERFPDLPRNVVENKIKSVFILKNFAFSGWEQRPYLFKFRHNRPVTGGVEYMYQDCTFMPIKNDQGDVDHICVTVVDSTDVAIYKKMHKEALDSLAEASHHDGLTGIYNRHFLEEAIAKEFNRAHRYNGTMSLIMLDIDHFKTINDTYGHLAGDEVLRIIAERLNATARQTDTLGRYGGEEFGILLPETTLETPEYLRNESGPASRR